MTIANHLRDRHMNVDLYKAYVDEGEGVATFLLFDLSGAVCGYQQYRPSADKERKNHPREGRYYTYRSPNRHGVFGMESWNWSRPLFITEGIFDCVRLHNLGLAAIATLSNDPKQLREWFRMISRPIFAICDSGDGGRKLAKFADESLVCDGGDLGSMTEEDVQKSVAHFL